MDEKKRKEIFKILHIKYLKIFEKFFKDYNLPKESNNALVIVEPREHYNLEFVIKNTCYYCRGWSLYIFHSKKNKKYIEKILNNKLKNINMIEFTDDNINKDEYNTLLKSKEKFWNKINAENILIFQTDTYIRKFGIEQYLKYDYIGAPWSKKSKYNNIMVGNGGLSLRNKQKMIEIIEKYNDNQDEDKINEYENEDIYFSYYGDKMNINIPDSEEAKKFSMEHIYYHDPLGVHQPEFILNYSKYKDSHEKNKGKLFIFELK